MKVLDVQLTPLESPQEPRSHVLVQLSTDAGITGIAIAPAIAASAARELVRDILRGEDPRAAMGLWEKMARAESSTDAGPARAALDVALWDIKAKACNEPLWKTHGGSRASAIAHLFWDGEPDLTAMLEWLRSTSKSTGIRSASIPSSDDPWRDAEQLKAAQAALGATLPQTNLMLHFPGTGWARDVIRHVQIVEKHLDIAWVGSPVQRDDVRGAKQVADHVGAAVCLGRGLCDVADFRPYLLGYAANIIQLDVGSLGVSGCLQMADAAFGFELPVVLTSFPSDLAVQLFHALPTSTSVEIGYRALKQSSLSTVTFDNGRALADVCAGNGIDVSCATRSGSAAGAQS
jgi:L-alanine-DL-glutamate epimerase-like enolase superfamily enzyme